MAPHPRQMLQVHEALGGGGGVGSCVDGKFVLLLLLQDLLMDAVIWYPRHSRDRFGYISRIVRPGVEEWDSGEEMWDVYNVI